MDGEESDEPERGFLWTLAIREGITFRDYGEMVKGNPGWPVTQRDLARRRKYRLHTFRSDHP